jgi:uncharacterized protein HemY
MTRWLVAVVVALAVLVGAGWIAFLNPGAVVVRLAPSRHVEAPLAGVLVAAFGTGALLVGIGSGIGATARRWRAWRERRRARREARRAAATSRAEHLLRHGSYARAREEILRIDGAPPTDVARLVVLAESHLHEGDPATARRLVEDGLRRVADPRLFELLADAAEATDDLHAAADALERARQALPDSPRLARRLRDVYMHAGRWPEALAVQGQIMLGLTVPSALAVEEQVLRGLRYQNALAEPEPRRASRALAALAREDRAFVPAWVSLGDVLHAAGRNLKARRAWERGAAWTLAPVLLDRLDQLNRGEGKPARTTKLYERLRRRHPDSPRLALFYARHLLSTSDYDRAAELLSGLPSEIRTLPLAHLLWGELNRRRGNVEVAANSFAHAMRAELGLAAFACAGCGRRVDGWQAYCGGCRRWGTFRGVAEDAPAATPAAAAPEPGTSRSSVA